MIILYNYPNHFATRMIRPQIGREAEGRGVWGWGSKVFIYIWLHMETYPKPIANIDPDIDPNAP